MAEYFDPNAVYFGFKNLHIAPFADNSTSTDPKWMDPIKVPGAVNFSPTANNSETNFFADDIKYFTTYVNNGFTGTLEVAKIPQEILVAVYKYVVDDNGVLLSSGGVGYRSFAMMLETQGDITPVRMVWYHCSAGLPTITYSTLEESTEPQTQSMDISASPQTFSDGKVWTIAQVPMNTSSDETMEIYNGWFESVYIPETTEAAAGQAAKMLSSGVTAQAQQTVEEANAKNAGTAKRG